MSSKSSPATESRVAQVANVRSPTTRGKVRNCCRKLFAFLFSQVGLAAMVVAYSIVGGFLFQALEAPAEARVVRRLAEDRRLQVENIVDKFYAELNSPISAARLPPSPKGSGGTAGKQPSFNGSSVARHVNRTRLIEEIDSSLILYQRLVATAIKENGWDGRDEKDQSMVKWSFAGALLFSVTVTTTIGYGHVVPKTPWGRFLTMVYALVGIPLTFLYLSTIGDFLAHGFRIFYRRVCCDVCCCRRCELARRRRHIERQIIKNSNISTAIMSYEAPSAASISSGPPAAGLAPPLYPWRSKLDVGVGSSSGLLARAGSLPDCVGSSTVIRDRSRGRSPGRIGAKLVEKMSVAGGREFLENPSSVVRYDSMKLKGVPTSGQNRRIERPLSEEAAKISTNDSSLVSGKSPKLTPRFAWLKKSRAANDVTGKNKPYKVIEIRSKSFDEDFRPARSTSGSRTDLQRTNESDASKKTGRRPVILSTLELPSNTRISRRNSDVVNTETRPTVPTVECAGSGVGANGRKPKLRGDTLRRSFSERRSQKEAVNVIERRSQARYDPTSFPVRRRKLENATTNDNAVGTSTDLLTDTDMTAVKMAVVYSRTYDHVSHPEVVLNVDVRPTMTSNDTRIVAELTGSDNMSVTSDGSDSLESFVTAPDNFSVTIDCTESDIDDENITVSGRTNVKLDDLNCTSPLIPPVTSTNSSSTKKTDLPQKIASGQPTVRTAGNTPNSNSDRVRSRAANIRIRFDSPPSRASSADYAQEEVEQRGETVPGQDGDLSAIGHHKVTCEKVRVPIYICLIVIIGYVLGGSVLFMLWEGWDVLEASYFCFVTLSTIGFGDIVPGTATGDRWNEASTEKLVLCILWLAFGLSLLAMCFNLMQEEVKEKCKTVAKKCGLISSDNT